MERGRSPSKKKIHQGERQVKAPTPRLLAYIAERGGSEAPVRIPCRELREATGLSRKRLEGLIRKLEELELLLVLRPKRGAAYSYALTDGGKAYYQRIKERECAPVSGGSYKTSAKETSSAYISLDKPPVRGNRKSNVSTQELTETVQSAYYIKGKARPLARLSMPASERALRYNLARLREKMEAIRTPEVFRHRVGQALCAAVVREFRRRQPGLVLLNRWRQRLEHDLPRIWPRLVSAIGQSRRWLFRLARALVNEALVLAEAALYEKKKEDRDMLCRAVVSQAPWNWKVLSPKFARFLEFLKAWLAPLLGDWLPVEEVFPKVNWATSPSLC